MSGTFLSGLRLVLGLGRTVLGLGSLGLNVEVKISTLHKDKPSRSVDFIGS